MDIATLIGLISGVSLIVWAMTSNASLQTFIDYPSVAIVVGGAVAATLIATPLKGVLNIGKVIKKTILNKPPDLIEVIKDLVRYAEVARRDGILALEGVIAEASDPFIVSGIQMAVDGTDPELVEQMLNSEIDSIAMRHGEGKGLFDTLGRYAPAFGMIGTLVGLVVMLQNMDDPSKIGPGMAVALLTTMYGALVANLIALPLADKLGIRSAEEMLHKEIVIKGIMSIQAGDNPRIVEQKLKTFLPPKVRDGMVEQEAA